jgi:hypothetical protein
VKSKSDRRIIVSSKPSKDGVAALRTVIHDYLAISAEAEIARKAAIRQQELEAKAREKYHLIGKMVTEMDCSAPGNFGWEGRIAWMLTELVKQEKDREEIPF